MVNSKSWIRNMIQTKLTSEILGDALRFLQEHSDITLISPGSTARALVESISSQISQSYRMADSVITNTMPASATGVFLDLLGELVGVKRRLDTAVRTSASDRNIRFYVNTGVLGDYIEKPGDATKSLIPDGTTIETRDGTAIFEVDTDHEAPAGAVEMFVTARAQTLGPAGSAGVGALVRHSLSSSVLVENLETIETGIQVETDEALRLRIMNAVVSAEGANETAIRVAALGAPGIVDIIIRPFSMGSGSFEIIAIPIGNRVPLESLLAIQNRIDSVISYGTYFVIREPAYIPISMDIEIDIPLAADEEKESIKASVAGRIAGYIGDLRPGDFLVIDRLREIIISTSQRITDSIIRVLRINNNPQLVANIKLKETEVFIPDPSVTDPFLVK